MSEAYVWLRPAVLLLNIPTLLPVGLQHPAQGQAAPAAGIKEGFLYPDYCLEACSIMLKPELPLLQLVVNTPALAGLQR